MSFIDIVIFVAYIIGVMIVGWYYYLKNENNEDYYVGGRNMSSTHVGLSVVATDVGGGFSIGLGGLGFVMGISGHGCSLPAWWEHGWQQYFSFRK